MKQQRVCLERGQNRKILAHPKRPPKKDLDELSFFSASATSSRALASLSDMTAASTKRTTVSYFFLVKTFLLLNNSFLGGDSHYQF